jgi:putative ABC transport system permease protein
MFRNFFKTALRIFWKRKAFSFLNITGLGIGIAATLLLFLVIQNELSYDRYHRNNKRIYRVVAMHKSRSNGETTARYAHMPLPLPDAMRQDFPRIEKLATIVNLNEAQIYVTGKNAADEKRFKETKGLFWVEPSLFEIFDFTWLAGNASDLKDPNTVVLAESVAKRFYGSVSAAMGNVIQLYSFRIPLRITGVFKDPPEHTDIEVRLGASFATHRNRFRNRFGPEGFTGKNAWTSFIGDQQCFVLAGKNESIASMQAQLPGFVKKYYPEDPQFTRQLAFQPLKSMHLDSSFGTFKNDALSVKELWSLGLIGAFLLLVACINFINLATAQSVNRAKEIGVRKVIGGSRLQLIGQFLQETSFVTFLALILACVLAVAALPLLNRLIQKDLSLNFLDNPSIPVYLLLTGLTVTLLAGFYPAMVLAGFKPVMIFKNKLTGTGSKGIYLRRGLVVFQFVIAQLLIIGTLVVVKQMQYFRSKPLGFEKDGIVLINLPSDSSLRVKYPMLRSRMEQLPGVRSVSLCMESPAPGWEYESAVFYHNDAKRRDFTVTWQFGDTGYYKTFGISLITGRFPFAADSTTEVVVNETMVKKLGIKSPENIIGKMVSVDGVNKVPVVGVVKDYNNKSLHTAISPLMISSENSAYEWIAVRMDRSKMSNTLTQVQQLFTGIYPTYLYDPYFFDQSIEQFYKNETITVQLFKWFSILAIFISCLGLYGLVSFLTVQKTKEVGIRKVLGAPVYSIVYLFSKEFTILIGIAFLIAVPVGYYFMNEWLSGFYYHTTMGVGIFTLAIVVSLAIAWITVGYKAIKAALVNPVKSLKME